MADPDQVVFCLYSGRQQAPLCSLLLHFTAQGDASFNFLFLRGRQIGLPNSTYAVNGTFAKTDLGLPLNSPPPLACKMEHTANLPALQLLRSGLLGVLASGGTEHSQSQLLQHDTIW